MGKVKCGRNTYILEKGDYVLDNGACLQFITKNKDRLPFGKWQRVNSVRVSKKEFKKFLKLPHTLLTKRNGELKYYVYTGK